MGTAAVPIEIQYIAHPDGESGGHFQPRDGTRVTSTGHNSCLLDTIAALCGISPPELQQGMLQTIRNNPHFEYECTDGQCSLFMGGFAGRRSFAGYGDPDEPYIPSTEDSSSSQSSEESDTDIFCAEDFVPLSDVRLDKNNPRNTKAFLTDPRHRKKARKTQIEYVTVEALLTVLAKTYKYYCNINPRTRPPEPAIGNSQIGKDNHKAVELEGIYFQNHFPINYLPNVDFEKKITKDGVSAIPDVYDWHHGIAIDFKDTEASIAGKSSMSADQKKRMKAVCGRVFELHPVGTYTEL